MLREINVAVIRPLPMQRVCNSNFRSIKGIITGMEGDSYYFSQYSICSQSFILLATRASLIQTILTICNYVSDYEK